MKDFFEWLDSYSVGVVELDDQHKEILELANDVIRAVEEKQEREVVGAIFSKIMELTEIHFKLEEDLMEQTGFPGFESHANEHKILKEQATQYGNQHKLGNINGTIFAMFLIGWVLIHIKKEDKKYTDHLNKNGIF